MLQLTKYRFVKPFITLAVISSVVVLTSAPATATSISNVPVKCRTFSKTICIVKGNGSHAMLYAVKNKTVLHAFYARTGDARGGSSITREGTFDVYWNDANHVSSIYHTAMPYSMFFSGGQAIHYSSDFAAVGYKGASHGCVNIRSDTGIRWLYGWSPVGTRVVVTR